MEQIIKQFGKILYYGIAAVLSMTLVLAALKSGGVVSEAVKNFMESIC